MSLDKNLFTLLLTPHKDNPNVIDLMDPSGTVHYRKQRVPGPEYKIEVYDPMSESLLATATAPSPTNKVKTIELCNPTSVVELKYTGTLTFRWSFKWEGNDFEWKREECYMIRKPDPPVIIAVTKEPSGRLKTTSVQILDYNLNRFDIDDRKGLEIVLLTALLTFQDANEAYHSPEATSSSTNPLSRASSAMPLLGSKSPLAETPPAPPPKPAPKTGIDRIAEMQAIKGEYNEIIVNAEGNIQEYAEYCNKLLQDDAMLFITVKSSEAEQVPKVLQVVEETKRIRYKAGLSEDEELHQYVLYDTQEAKKGPKRINLDDDPKNKYAPPKNLTVHLSKISMPELQPKGHLKDNKNPKDSKKKEDKKAATTSIPARPAPPAPVPMVSGPPTSSMPTLKPPINKLHRPGRNSSPAPPRVQPHMVHPNQPSPSPPQINNPGIYAAPPPTRPSPRPSTGNAQSSGPPATSAPPFPQPQVSSNSNWGKSTYGAPPPNGPSPSLYGSHAPHSSISSPPSTTTSFPPTNWAASSTPASTQPQLYQPQPVNANQTTLPLGVKSSVVQGASTVVLGLMDKLKTHTNRR